MAKRRPEFELNHDNWDEELPAQEVGVFSLASNEEISNRVIRKAKRRLPDTESSMNKGVFANFSGFGKPTNSNGNLFSFLDSKAKTLDLNKKINFSMSAIEPVALKPSSPSSLIFNKNNLGNSNETKSGINNSNKPRAEYLQKLRKLNQDFVTWIQSHFDKNPYLDLTPVFKDYDVHLKNLEEKYQDNNKIVSGSTTIIIPTIEEKIPPVTLQKPLITTLVSTVDGTSGQRSDQKEETKQENEDEEEQNYKTEVKVVEEENTQFKTRCKLFYKKDAAYVEKGVGTLYIKSIDNNKSSLLIRAETSLGSILMNILLSSSIPTQRIGKNNVSVICIPNPPITSKSDDANQPVTFLIRVKDAELADELLKKLEEAKNI